MGTKGTNKTEMLKEYAVITAGIFLTALAVYFQMCIRDRICWADRKLDTENFLWGLNRIDVYKRQE